MSNYLITGVAGSGKSTVGQELHRRGYRVVDTDRIWGQQVQLSISPPLVSQHYNLNLFPDHPVHRLGAAWVWDIKEAKRTLESKSSARFFVGGSDNEFILYNLFDKIFVLSPCISHLIDMLKLRSGHITSSSNFIEKTRDEIIFRSRYSSLHNVINLKYNNLDPKAFVDIITHHVPESTLERGARTLRVLTGLPRMHMLMYRGKKAWRAFKRKRAPSGVSSWTR